MLTMLLKASVFAVPLPGQHTATPKYWAEIDRWVTNFSPYSFSGSIAQPVMDDDGGLWFGVGQTAEHIDARGRMTSSVFATGPRTNIYGAARAPDGRVWFSLGQTGFIGMIDPEGTPRTRVLVQRRYLPDIRAIAFATNGALFFLDRGRSSIGRRSPDGHVDEVPIPGGATQMTLCGDDIWVDGYSNGSPKLIAFPQTSLAAPTPIRVGSGSITSLACDGQHRVVAAYNRYAGYDGAVLRGNRSGLRAVSELALQVSFVSASPDGTIRVTGYATGIEIMSMRSRCY